MIGQCRSPLAEDARFFFSFSVCFDERVFLLFLISFFFSFFFLIFFLFLYFLIFFLHTTAAASHQMESLNLNPLGPAEKNILVMGLLILTL